MADKRPQISKLTRPRLHDAVPRERLYRLLDEARERKPVICVAGPPGAGKTTLVASWLAHRKIKCLWYLVDSGDADLASFSITSAKPRARSSAGGSGRCRA